MTWHDIHTCMHTCIQTQKLWIHEHYPAPRMTTHNKPHVTRLTTWQMLKWTTYLCTLCHHRLCILPDSHRMYNCLACSYTSVDCDSRYCLGLHTRQRLKVLLRVLVSTHAPHVTNTHIYFRACRLQTQGALTSCKANTFTCRVVAVQREACVTAGTHRRLVSGAVLVGFWRAVSTRAHVFCDVNERNI